MSHIPTDSINNINYSITRCVTYIPSVSIINVVDSISRCVTHIPSDQYQLTLIIVITRNICHTSTVSTTLILTLGYVTHLDTINNINVVDSISRCVTYIPSVRYYQQH